MDIALPTCKATTAHIVSLLRDNWIILYGMLMHVLMDNGTQFVSKFFETLGTF